MAGLNSLLSSSLRNLRWTAASLKKIFVQRCSRFRFSRLNTSIEPYKTQEISRGLKAINNLLPRLFKSHTGRLNNDFLDKSARNFPRFDRGKFSLGARKFQVSYTPMLQVGFEWPKSRFHGKHMTAR